MKSKFELIQDNQEDEDSYLDIVGLVAGIFLVIVLAYILIGALSI